MVLVMASLMALLTILRRMMEMNKGEDKPHDMKMQKGKIDTFLEKKKVMWHTVSYQKLMLLVMED